MAVCEAKAMQYAVIGLDGKDQDALNRRLVVREKHIELSDKLRAEGKALFGYALLNQEGQMIGSVYVMQFDTRQELDDWLKIEPYVTGNVWQEIEVKPVKVGPSFVGATLSLSN